MAEYRLSNKVASLSSNVKLVKLLLLFYFFFGRGIEAHINVFYMRSLSLTIIAVSEVSTSLGAPLVLHL